MTATLAYDTPDALSPVPAKTFPSIAEIVFATPFLGKSTAVILRFGAHQSLRGPPLFPPLPLPPPVVVS